MKLFLPSARATNWLLIVGFCALGYALYMRYMAIEQSAVGLACAAGLDTWLCYTRKISSFCSSIRCSASPRLASLRSICCGHRWCFSRWRLRAACLGIVLYNIGLVVDCRGLLVLSFARRAPAPE